MSKYDTFLSLNMRSYLCVLWYMITFTHVQMSMTQKYDTFLSLNMRSYLCVLWYMITFTHVQMSFCL